MKEERPGHSFFSLPPSMTGGFPLDWFDEYEWLARRDRDLERIRLGSLHRESYHHRESDPDHAIALLREGRHLAERLREPWWMLYYDQQHVHALLHFKQDYRDVLELAVRNTLEVRKPVHAAFPRRLMIHGDLVSAYLGIDPLGHALAIQQALDYLHAETPAEGDDRYLLLGTMRQFALERDRLDEAQALSRRSLELAAADPDRGRAQHFLVFCYSGLAEIAWKRGDHLALAEAAQIGGDMAHLVGHQVEVAGFRLWQAFVARVSGDETRASRLHRHAVTRLDRLQMPPDASYRDAECAYHEWAGDFARALDVRERELAAIQERGRFAYECQVLTRRAWLRSRLGVLSGEDLARARRAAGRLRETGRDHALERIERVARGETP